jgi:hypothetical protein
VVSATPQQSFNPRKRTPGIQWIGGWVGFKAGLDTEAREKKSFASAEVRTPVVQSTVSYYILTDMANTNYL